MLGTAETIGTVAAALDLIPEAPVVLDPVMIAESGARLLDEEALDALRNTLLPLVTVVTPNLPEARILADDEDADPATLAERSTRSARRPSSSRAATARRQPTSSSTAIDWSRFRASATPTGLHTDRAAHIRPRSRPGSRSASTRWRRPNTPS